MNRFLVFHFMYRPSLDDRLISLPDKLCVRRGLKVMYVCEEEPTENWRGLSASCEGKVDEDPVFWGVRESVFKEQVWAK